MSAGVLTATDLLLAWGRGEDGACDRLMPLVYEELRRIAAHYMRREASGRTLQASALVNEVYLRLVQVDKIELQNRAHFFALAARVMRRVLVDSARARTTEKRGRGVAQVSFEDADKVTGRFEVDFISLDAALRKLESVHPRKVRVVELRFFAGLTLVEAAMALEISVDTVKRDWQFARLWLLRELQD